MRRICAFSGKRGGYGAYVPLLRQVAGDPELELLILLADQHASAVFGSTGEEARAAFPDAELEVVDIGTGRSDFALTRVENLGRCLHEVGRVLERWQPDVVLVHGDRAEHLVVALAALTLDIPVAHTQGGDRSGNVDEIQRHAISKLAHLHFAETDAAAERLLRLGEEDWRIHVVGSTYVDRIVQGLYASPAEARASVGLDATEPFLLVLVHPETWRSREENRRLAEKVLEGVRLTGLRAVATYPVSDPGYGAVLEALQADATLILRPNVENDVYLGLMADAEALVGNSSAALIEAPYLGLPAVNVGGRQAGRERDANVIDSEESAAAVAASIGRARSADFRAGLEGLPTRLGDGRAAERIVAVLKQTDRDTRLLRKRLTY